MLDWIHYRTDASAQWNTYVNRYDSLVPKLFEPYFHGKSEYHQRCLLRCLESDWSWQHMNPIGHLTSNALYMGVCECAAAGKLRRMLGSS